MVELEDYINDNTVVKDSFYASIKDSITCPICLDLMIKPYMCMNCLNNYCRRCIEYWSNVKNSCPNRCRNTEYKSCLFIEKLLAKLNFTCKDCNSVINYEKMERHILSKCDTVEIKNLIDNNPSAKNGILRKINQKNKNFQNIKQQIKIKIKCKYIYNIILYFYFSIYSNCPWSK